MLNDVRTANRKNLNGDHLSHTFLPCNTHHFVFWGSIGHWDYKKPRLVVTKWAPASSRWRQHLTPSHTQIHTSLVIRPTCARRGKYSLCGHMSGEVILLTWIHGKHLAAGALPQTTLWGLSALSWKPAPRCLWSKSLAFVILQSCYHPLCPALPPKDNNKKHRVTLKKWNSTWKYAQLNTPHNEPQQ